MVDRPLSYARYSANMMYKGGAILPQIRPISDPRNTSQISEACPSRREPIFITKNGYGDLVITSICTYEEMLDTAQLAAAISEAEAEAECRTDAKLHGARTVLSSLRKKHLG